MERDVEFELTPSSTSPSEQVVHTLRGGSDNGRGRCDDGLSRESKSALPCLMLEVRRIRWWRWYRQTNERSFTKPSVLYPRCFSTRFHSFPYWYFTVGCKAVCIFNQKSFQRLGKFLQKSSYEDSCVCISLCAHVCMCLYVCVKVCVPPHCLWEANRFNRGSSYTQHSPSSWKSCKNTSSNNCSHVKS